MIKKTDLFIDSLHPYLAGCSVSNISQVCEIISLQIFRKDKLYTPLVAQSAQLIHETEVFSNLTFVTLFSFSFSIFSPKTDPLLNISLKDIQKSLHFFR